MCVVIGADNLMHNALRVSVEENIKLLDRSGREIRKVVDNNWTRIVPNRREVRRKTVKYSN